MRRRRDGLLMGCGAGEGARAGGKVGSGSGLCVETDDAESEVINQLLLNPARVGVTAGRGEVGSTKAVSSSWKGGTCLGHPLLARISSFLAVLAASPDWGHSLRREHLLRRK